MIEARQPPANVRFALTADTKGSAVQLRRWELHHPLRRRQPSSAPSGNRRGGVPNGMRNGSCL